MSLPLPELTAYRLADANPASNDLHGLLEAIHTRLGASVDYRGTALPTTHQWTRGRYQNAGVTEAVYATRPGSVMTLDPAILFAGAASASGATFQTDTFLASGCHVGIAKNAGSYNAWDNAAPFTSGEWSGFNRAFPTAANATSTVVRMYVTQETIILDVWTSATAHYFVVVGAPVEAHTDHIDACESDSRLYGCFTSGAFVAAASNLLATTSQFLDHVTSTAGTSHGFVFEPGTANIRTCGRNVRAEWTPVAGNEVDETGAYVFGEVHIARSTATNVQNGKRTGRLRDVFVGGLIQGARTRQNALGEDLFHVLGCDSSAAGQAYVIRAAA